MKNLFKDQQILAITVGSVAAAIITAWIMNPQSGPAGWIKGLPPAAQHTLSGIAIAFVIASVGLLVSSIAGGYARTGALQPGNGKFPTPRRTKRSRTSKPWSASCRSSARSTD